MVTLFNALVFFHVAAAIVWLGSGITLEILEFEAAYGSTRGRIMANLRRGSWFGARVFAPAAITTILTGILAVAVGRPTFGQLWVIMALIGVAAAAALGAGILGRTSDRLAKRMGEGAPDAEIAAGLARIRAASQLDLAILVFILFDMVVRPVAFDPGFFIASGIFFVAVACGIILSRTKGQAKALLRG
ncbi:MAG TPA: DUF2269 family protein [Candidatus Paceibacterota bacterium]|nr:DUF2269 family protein [Candidatus Paceibacterota bacterium]